MEILYGKTEVKTQEFRYTINGGGSLDLQVSNGSTRVVTITFIDGKFSSAEHNIEGSFEGTRSYWHVMGAIAEKITEIEKTIK